MNYYVRKMISFILTLMFVSALAFILFQIIPGDSAIAKLGMNAEPEAVEALRESLGLNDSLGVRFFHWISGVVKGDFGASSQYGVSVSSLLADRFTVTVWLGVLAIVMIIVFSLPLGIWCSRREGGIADRTISFLSQIFMAVPPFFMGIIMTLLFGIVLKLFTPGGYHAPAEGFLSFLGFMIFPALAVALPRIGMTVKFMKSSIQRELRSDYVRTAVAKGNTRNEVLWKHVLKNSLLPVITFIGMLFAEVLAGSIMIEQVFNLPGMGRLLVSAISNRDFPVVQAVVMYIALIVIAANFIVDILYQIVDPRVRL